MTWFLDLRANPVGGGVASHVTLRQGGGHYPYLDGFLDQVRGRDLLLATHGFNVDRADGIAKLSAWEALLQLPDNYLFVGVLWPGDSRWVPVLDYPVEDREATDSAALLASFVRSNFGAALSLSFSSHSLGARVLLETVRRLTNAGVPVNQAVVMAGAIDDDCLATQYADSVAKLRDISLLASLEDDVLKWAFPLGNPLAGIISEGHPYWRGALGRYGPSGRRPANLGSAWQIPDAWNYGHGNYLGASPQPKAQPVSLPAPSNPVLPDAEKPAWSAGFVATRLRRVLGR